MRTDDTQRRANVDAASLPRPGWTVIRRGRDAASTFRRSHALAPMRARGGFTLIEVLLGAVVSAILLAALYAIFQGLLQAQAHATTRLEESLPLAQVVSLMKNDIENISAPNGLLCGDVFGEHNGDADHCSDTLEFSATSGKPAGTLPWGEVQRVAYSLEPPDDESKGAELELTRTVTRNLLSADPEDDQEITILLESVQSLEFEYYDGEVWQDSWDSTTMLENPPRAVRVRILLAGDPAKNVPGKTLKLVCEVAARPGPREGATPASGSSGSGTASKGASVLSLALLGFGAAIWPRSGTGRARARNRITCHLQLVPKLCLGTQLSEKLCFDEPRQASQSRASGSDELRDRLRLRLRLRARARSGAEGMVLVIVLWIVLGLSTVVLLFAESTRMEYRISANGNAALEADQAIEGARRYLAYVLDNYAAPGMLPESDTFEVEDVPIGDASFWVIGRPEETLADADTPEFGLIDEASKLNLNTATREMLEMLPNMTPEVAAAILDWRNSADEPQPDGAESQAYTAGDPAYLCKNAPFESVEELRLVKGVTPELLYGSDTNRNGILDPDEQEGHEETDSTSSSASSAPLMFGSSTWRGLLDFVTVWSREPNTQANGQPRIDVRKAKNAALNTLLQERLSADRASQIAAAVNPHAGSINSVLEFFVVGGVTAAEAARIEGSLTANNGSYILGRVNVNTAPREVLVCLPGIGEKYADTLIATRQAKVPEDLDSITWVMEVLEPQSAVLAGPYVTTRSYQISADVAAAGRHGRALRRSWMVFDTLESKSVVVYRCDETHLGWPLGVPWREALDSSDRPEGQGNSRSPQKAGGEAT